MSGSQQTGLDLTTVIAWLGAFIVSILSFLGAYLWNDVQELKKKMITSDELKEELRKVEQMIGGVEEVQEDRHSENTGNFKRIDHRLTQQDAMAASTAISVEKRLGEILVKIAELRPAPPNGHERRRPYGK
jgi:hypothetical protein